MKTGWLGEWRWMAAVLVACCCAMIMGCEAGSGQMLGDAVGTSSLDPQVEVAPAAIPPEVVQRLDALEETLTEKTEAVATKDEAVAALEQRIEELTASLEEKETEQRNEEAEIKAQELEEAKAQAEKARIEAEEARKALETVMGEVEGLKAALEQAKAEANAAAEEAKKANDETEVVRQESAIGNELLSSAYAQMTFTNIHDVNESPGLGSKDQWICLLLFKEDPSNVSIPASCTGSCYSKVMEDVNAAAAGRVCYAVEGCWDEDNDGAGNDISRCQGPRKIDVVDSQTKLSDIRFAKLLAHDTDGDDFNFTISRIRISAGNTESVISDGLSGSVDHQFLFLDLGPVTWE